jgi:hypothetical protein
MSVCSHIHAEDTNTLYGQNAEFLYLKPGGTNSNHRALNVIVQHTVGDMAINTQKKKCNIT